MAARIRQDGRRVRLAGTAAVRKGSARVRELRRKGVTPSPATDLRVTLVIGAPAHRAGGVGQPVKGVVPDRVVRSDSKRTSGTTQEVP
jgi:hypothetical protein